MRLATLPIKYLGSYLYKGINQAAYCVPLLANFDAKLHFGSCKLLTTAGQLTLIRHVLRSMPSHIIASSRLPASGITSLNQKMANFSWNGRHHWQSWDMICRPAEDGGLGI